MDLSLSPEDLAFKAEVDVFLADQFTPDLRAQAARQAGVFADGDLARRWHKILFERGWIAPAWPKDFGGAEFTPVQRYLFDTAMAEAGAPAIPAMGLQMCGPALMGHGSPEQRAYFLPRILSGEHYWCQGYSEPGSGSDLASLQCRAVRDGDDYVVTGTKIWTTHAHFANWMFLLVRTDTTGKPQAGITFLLLDMDTPGLTVTPIVSISGEHEVNQVFFDGVRIPAKNRVGAENQGWSVAKYLLEFERGGGSFSARLNGALKQLERIARTEQSGGDCLWSDPAFRRKLADICIETTAIAYTERRVVSALSTGQSAGGTAASQLKLKGTEMMQRATELALEAIGCYGAADQRDALRPGSNGAVVGRDYATTPTARYLNTRAATIYGGSSEVQRNILARAALGL